MTWSDYEIEIFNFFRSAYPTADIRPNISLKGQFSKVPRQIDILIEDYVAGSRFRTVVDGKFFSTRVDVKDIECFMGMLNDVEAHKGILITQQGYSEAAINRAHYDQIDLELDILNFKDLKHLQGEIAIPYAGNNVVLMPAPLGWVIDAKRQSGFVAALYQRGLTIEEAYKQNEWIYINFWEKSPKAKTIEELTKLQEEKLRERFPDVQISYLPTIKRPGAQILLRKANIPSYTALEYTGFVEFKDFIFFAVLFTPVEIAKRNIRKLEYVMAKVIPGKIQENTAVNKMPKPKDVK